MCKNCTCKSVGSDLPGAEDCTCKDCTCKCVGSDLPMPRTVHASVSDLTC